jgi:hypothetical protein
MLLGGVGFRYDYLQLCETLQFFVYDNWTSLAVPLNTSLDGNDKCVILELGTKNKNLTRLLLVC